MFVFLVTLTQVLSGGVAAPEQGTLEVESAVRELVLRGSVQFELPSTPDSVTHIGRRCVDSLGRVWISEWDTATIHVFDAGGTALLTCTPERADGLSYHPYEWFHLTAEGHLLAGTRETLVEFDAQGKRLVCSAQPAPVQRLYVSDESYWEVGEREIALVSSELGRRVVRQSRKGFGEFWRASVAADGTLAVCEELERDTASRRGELTLHLLAAGGNPLATLDLVLDGWLLGIAFDGRDVALLVTGTSSTCFGYDFPPWEILRVSVDGGRVVRARLPDSPAPAQIAFSRDGEELWVFRSKEPALDRYAWPPRR